MRYRQILDNVQRLNSAMSQVVRDAKKFAAGTRDIPAEEVEELRTLLKTLWLVSNQAASTKCELNRALSSTK